MDITATQAKQRFGAALGAALGGETVTITKHGHPAALLVNVATFERMKRKVRELNIIAKEGAMHLAGESPATANTEGAK